jgi:hypothetical protein
MRRQPERQTHFVLLELDGQTHRRDCECARCEAGFRPAEAEREEAARKWQAHVARAKAEAALAKKREKERVKALRLELELDQEWHQTKARLDEQAELLARIKRDGRLDELLDLRRAGKPISEALAQVEHKFRPTGT